MPRPLTIPTPGASGITLTIKGNTAERKVTRGTQDTAADSGLFTVPSGTRLIFESIVIDGNKAAHTGNLASLVRVNAGGIFTMNEGAVLQNNRATNGGGVYVTGSGGTFTMSGGDIKNNTATSSGGGVYVGSSGTFTMSGGTISGNTANGTGTTNGGGGVYVTGSSSTFTMNSGDIKNNTATSSGGGVYVYSSGTFTMSGGTISGNAANGTGTNGGGGVYVSSGTFNMYGGVINGGNKAAGNGGGVYVSGGTFRVGGTAKVSGNTKTDSTTNNVYLPGTYITLGTGGNAPVSGMDISVQTTRADGVIVQSGATAAIQTYFKADEAGKSVNVLSGMIIIGDFSLSPQASNFYTQVQSYGTALADVLITVSEDLTLPIPVNIPAPTTSGITLTIRGNVATRKLTRGTQDTAADSGLFTVPSGARLIFENIVIDGDKAAHTGNTASLVRVTGGTFTMNAGAVLQNNRATSGGGVYVNGGTFTMNSGTISGNTATTSGGGVYFYSGTFTMSGGTISGNMANNGGGVYVYANSTISGGTISGNTATTSGGGVYINGNYTLTMSGGTISGNTANGTGTNGGGGVYVSGTFNMYGGVINGGNKAAGNGGGVYSGGTFTVGKTAQVFGNTKLDTVTISNVYLPSTYITLGAAPNAPTAGMDISVQTARDDGVIVENVTNGAAAAYFKADVAGRTVVFDINALRIVE